MKINIDGLTLIKRYEGLKLKAYLCPAKVWTIGYGTTRYPNGKPVKEGDKCNLEEAEKFLVHDVSIFEEGVLKAIRKPLTANQISALTSWSYNLGLGALGKSTLLKKVNLNPDDATIRDEFMKWVNAGGKKLTGLVKRRNDEANLYFKK